MLKIEKVVIALLLLCGSGMSLADGKRLVAEHCMACHVIDGEGGQKQAAPPMYAVWHHYRQRYPQKEQFIAALTAWVQQPRQERALMLGAINKFGLMERPELTPEQAHTIASYLAEQTFELPTWYLMHFNKRERLEMRPGLEKEKEQQAQKQQQSTGQ